MFKTKEDALKYLRKCSFIIMPSLYTYWCHSSLYSPYGKSNGKLWSFLPTDVVEVKKELSMLSRTQRFKYTVEHQDLKHAPTYYKVDNNQSPMKYFQLKVVMPKNNLTTDEKKSLGKDDQYFLDYARAYSGLGDGRHPKLPNKTKIYLFGYMKKDEMSGKPIDTVWGVREEDLIDYANAVLNELYKTHDKYGYIPVNNTPLFPNETKLYEFENKREMLNYGPNLKLEKAKENNLDYSMEL